MDWLEFWRQVEVNDYEVLVVLGVDSVENWAGTPQQALEQVSRFFNSTYKAPTSWKQLLEITSKIGLTEAQVVDYLKPRFDSKERKYEKWWYSIRDAYVKGVLTTE